MTGRVSMTILAAVVFVGCSGVGGSTPLATEPPAAPRAAPSGTHSAPPSARPTPDAGNPAAIVGRSIPADLPRLVPSGTPAGMTSRTTVGSDWYVVLYVDDPHTKEIYFTDEFGVNPPPQTSPHAVSARPQFRGVTATYVVYDGSAPTSERYLMWDEPGTWPTGQNGMRTNEFYLEASGLTEEEFFKVADSLRSVT